MGWKEVETEERWEEGEANDDAVAANLKQYVSSTNEDWLYMIMKSDYRTMPSTTQQIPYEVIFKVQYYYIILSITMPE